jgi:diguanylate cyclase (GGDEF)-like protein
MISSRKLQRYYRNVFVVRILLPDWRDEFAVIIPKLDEATVDRIIQRLRDRIGVYNHTLPANRQGKIINLSIGSATTVEGMEMEELFKAADKHMYQEKKKKRKSSQCQ